MFSYTDCNHDNFAKLSMDVTYVCKRCRLNKVLSLSMWAFILTIPYNLNTNCNSKVTIILVQMINYHFILIIVGLSCFISGNINRVFMDFCWICSFSQPSFIINIKFIRKCISTLNPQVVHAQATQLTLICGRSLKSENSMYSTVVLKE